MVMSRKLLLLSLSLFFIIGNATENEQRQKIKAELRKIHLQKTRFQERRDFCKQILRRYERLLNSSVETNDLKTRVIFSINSAIFFRAMHILNKYNPGDIIEREVKLRKKLANLEQQEAVAPQENQLCTKGQIVNPEAKVAV